MFGHCCGHATFVAERQPRSAGSTNQRVHPRLDRFNFEQCVLTGQKWDNRRRDFSSTHEAASHRRAAKAENAIRAASGAPDRSAAVAQPIVVPSDSDRGEAITTFLCDRHFLRAFSSRNDPPSNARTDCIFCVSRKPKQRRARFVAGFSACHQKCGARLKTSRTNAFRVTILPPPRAKPPRARPAADRFGWSSFDAGEGLLPHVLPARITLRFPKSMVVVSCP